LVERCSTSGEVSAVKVGIFGGTFDPVHQGHMVIAEQVMGELGFSHVLFVPGGIPPHKEASSVRASAEDRFDMVEAAVAENERFSVDRVEVNAGRPMHSVETVGILKERSPGDEWYFISGADEVSNLLAWKDPDRLLEEVVMVAATRPGFDLSKLGHLEAGLRNFDRIFPVECTRVDISATGIRRRILQGKSVRYLVPEGVYRIIRDKGLYEGDEGRSEKGGRLKEETR
jgi:nicotinate-nucleotide adenylyltransferase